METKSNKEDIFLAGVKMDEEVPLLEVHGRSPRRNVMYDLVRGCAAEFAATMVFVFAGTMAVVQGNVIGVALTHGLTIALLVVAFGSIRWAINGILFGIIPIFRTLFG